jgi:hypothetical protein
MTSRFHFPPPSPGTREGLDAAFRAFSSLDFTPGFQISDSSNVDQHIHFDGPQLDQTPPVVELQKTLNMLMGRAFDIVDRWGYFKGARKSIYP